MGFYPARDALQKTIGFETPERSATAMQHYSVTVILFTIFLIFGVQINSLGKVYSFVGGLASSFLAYIIPGFTFIAVFHPTWLPAFIRKEAVNQDPKLVVEQPAWWLNIGSVILVLFGTLVMSFTIIGTLRS
jgi:sodium-coupled neutral amino acid transporter 11